MKDTVALPALHDTQTRGLSGLTGQPLPRRYLQRIVNHPTMLQDPDVREFLEKEEVSVVQTELPTV